MPGRRRPKRPVRRTRVQWAKLLGPFNPQDRPLRLSLFRRLVATILEGKLSAGEVLPSTRLLAGELGISRNTVIQTYGMLVAEGFVETRPQSGFRVAPISVASPAHQHEAEAANPFRFLWRDKFPGSVAELPRLRKTSRWRECRYPFVYGQYDAETFPVRQWREAERGTMAIESVRRWAADPYDADDADLVRQIRDRLLPRRGVWAGDDEILLTAGTQNALFLIANLLMDRSTVAAIEEPGYPDAVAVLRMHAGKVQAVPVDADGLVVDAIPPDVSLIYCTPSHQYPTTVTMSSSRRRELLQHARRNDAVIIEDDYEAEMRFSGRHSPALKSLDEDGRVVLIGSFSKSLAPGLRIGFVVAHRDLVRELRLLRRLVLRNPPTNNQQALAAFLAFGYYDSHLERLRRVYRERYEVLEQAMSEFPELRFTELTGGSAVWLELPRGVDSAELGSKMIKRSVFVEIGDWLFQSPPARSCSRIGFSSITRELIPQGIALLAQGIREEAAAADACGLAKTAETKTD